MWKIWHSPLAVFSNPIMLKAAIIQWNLAESKALNSHLEAFLITSQGASYYSYLSVSFIICFLWAFYTHGSNLRCQYYLTWVQPFFCIKLSIFVYEIFINFLKNNNNQGSFLDKDHLFCINFGPQKSGFLVQICSFLFWILIIYGLSIQTSVSQKFAFALI